MITQATFEERIKNRFPEEDFTILEYSGAGGLLRIRCETCQQIITVNHASNFLAKNKRFGCKNCHGLWRERENRLKIIQDKYDIVKTEIKDTHTYYTIKCKKCGHQRNSTLNNLYTHLECGCTTKHKRNRNAEEFMAEVREINGDQFELIGPYTNQTTKVLIRHSVCGFIWKVSPSVLLDKRNITTCPKCRDSGGASIITSFLEKSNIPFEKEKKLNDSKLRFDFFLPTFNLAIEFNGRQHYEPVDLFGGVETFKQQQARDQRKRQYCIDNNIILLEIPYTYNKNQIIKILQGSTTKVGEVTENSVLINNN